MEEEDFFSDGDLDDIPDNTLQELEQHAISSTQRVKTAARPPPSQPLRRQIHNATSLNRSQKTGNNLPWRPPQRQPPPVRVQAQSRPAPITADPPSSDYGFDDEHIIDLDEPSMVIQPASGPQSRTQSRQTSRTISGYGNPAGLDDETTAAFAAADAELGAHAEYQWAQAPHLRPQANDGGDMQALQVRIAELEAEQARLRQSEQVARNAALAKQGEIAIVRTNQEKATREFERRISVMQKLHSDETTKHKIELESTRKEREKMETDNRFLQHDLAQEAERTKRMNGTGRVRVTKDGDTPRKTRRHGLGDGFEDDEVRIVSPSRSRDKPKDQTPKVGSKRKRSAPDSPLPVLSFTQPLPALREQSTEQSISAIASLTTSTSSTADQRQYEYMQRMLNHKQREGADRTVELLSRYHLPSDSARSLSSVFLDGLAFPMCAHSKITASLHVSRVLLKMWTSCLLEKYHGPLALILDMLQAALLFEAADTISGLIEEAVPAILQTVDLLVTPLVRASQRTTIINSQTLDPKDEDSYALDMDDVMDLLSNICQCASLSRERLEVFWRSMSFKVTLLTLNKVQSISQLTSALRIVATSALDSTFGPVSDDAATQAQIDKSTVDRLLVLLFDTPTAPQDEPPYTQEEIAELRIETLAVFKRLCLTDHGGQLLAHHRTAIGRLVRFLNAQVLQLYTVTPSIGLIRDDLDTEPTSHDLIVQIVNMTVRILHHLLHTFDSSIELNQKLAATAGGYHKFLVSMTRIAFSEQLVCESGIETEAMEAAHDILDTFLSPEEGEAIAKAVETPRGTRSTTTRKDPSGESGDDEMEIDETETNV